MRSGSGGPWGVPSFACLPGFHGTVQAEPLTLGNRGRLIIAGSRGLIPSERHLDAIVCSTIRNPGEIREVITGRARGVDAAAEVWARRRRIPVAPFPADWTRYGSSAGPVRNAAMADYGDALLAIWDGQSPGTRNMAEQMERRGKPYRVVPWSEVRR